MPQPGEQALRWPCQPAGAGSSGPAKAGSGDAEWAGAWGGRVVPGTAALELTTRGWFSCIMLHRATGEGEFAPRHRHLLHLFDAELGRLWGRC